MDQNEFENLFDKKAELRNELAAAKILGDNEQIRVLTERLKGIDEKLNPPEQPVPPFNPIRFLKRGEKRIDGPRKINQQK